METSPEPRPLTWYDRWHRHPGHHYVHWIIFLVVAAAVGWYLLDVSKKVVLNVDLSESEAAKGGGGGRGTGGSGGASFTLAFANPGALAQPTELGKRIHALASFDGKIFSGYGDYGVNTGPIDLYGFVPSTKQLTKEFAFGTESVEQFQVINNLLYTPAIDPTGSGPHYAQRPVASSWQAMSNVSGVIHAFDIESFGGNLYLAGSSGNSAVLWRSADNGQTWQKVLTVPPLQGFARFYMVFGLQGKLYVQAVDSEGISARPASWVSSDGLTWENTGPSLLQFGEFGHDPQNFFNGVVYRSRPYYVGGLEYFDGTKVVTAGSLGGVGGHTVALDGRLYVVTWERDVFRTSDFVTWEKIGAVRAKGNPQGSSILVTNDTIYVGLSNGSVYSSPVTP